MDIHISREIQISFLHFPALHVILFCMSSTIYQLLTNEEREEGGEGEEEASNDLSVSYQH